MTTWKCEKCGKEMDTTNWRIITGRCRDCYNPLEELKK